MVDPSPPITACDNAALAAEKDRLRREFRKARKDHVAALPSNLRALILNRPPSPLLSHIPQGASIGLYYPNAAEAPSLGWARWFSENGHAVALPWFASREANMTFRTWDNPWEDGELETGPWRSLQPKLMGSQAITPDVVIVPLVAFTADGHRLGQGGGHYDKWLAAHPSTPAIGLAWDCQLAQNLPIEAHDRILTAIVTPTRFYPVQPAGG